MDLNDLKKLAGINSPLSNVGSNPSITAAEKKAIEREQNIKPGTDEWFQLWFSKPYLTGERVPGFRGRKK
jgi:hypothetical protein